MNLRPDSGLRRQTGLGILCALAASLVFSVNDISIKHLAGEYALHQVILFRAGFGMLFVVVCVLPFSGGVRALRSRRRAAHMLRALCVIGSNLCYFLGLAALPLAQNSALFYVAPLFVTMLSVPFLGERVGWRRWAAVAVGLSGVIVMLRPWGGGMHWAMALPILSALCYAMSNVMARLMKGTESAVAMTFHVQLGFLVVCGAMGLAAGGGGWGGQADPSLAFLLRAWIWPAPTDYLIFAAIGLASATGGLLIAQAYRMLEAGVAAPFEYAAVPVAIFWGMVLFREWPDARTWVAAALICGAGLFVFWREMRLRGQA